MSKSEVPLYSSSRRNYVHDNFIGMAEKTCTESPQVYKSQFNPYNSDDIYQKTGDYSIFEEMKNDDQISVALQLKKDLVIGSGWSIVTQKDGDQEIADDIFARLEEDPAISLDDQLEDFVDNAWSFGFALAEKLFKMRDDNSLTFDEIKTRHPNSWLIHTDKGGNVKKYEQICKEGNVDVKPKSLMHYVNNRAHQNPYGKSDLRACYDAWFVKRHIIRYYSIFLEKFASPTPVARYDKNAPKAKIDDQT